MNAPTRLFCHAEHYCHHWFEDECSDACDRGEHNYPHGHEGCDRPSTPDPRLSDTRVRSARKPVWDQGETEWDDNNQLRPGFVERLAPYDPTPEYSRLDAENGLGAPVEPVTDPHGLSALGIGIIATATLLAGCAVVVLIALGVAWVAGYRP